MKEKIEFASLEMELCFLKLLKIDGFFDKENISIKWFNYLIDELISLLYLVSNINLKLSTDKLSNEEKLDIISKIILLKFKK